MKRKKLSKRGSVIIALLAVIAALAAFILMSSLIEG